MKKQITPQLKFHPVTPARLPDLARFSEAHGKFRYCSCMRWRLPSTEFQRSTKESRVAALEGLVRQGTPIGVLAYLDGEPVGWCSIAPRETYGALERYRALPRLDDAPSAPPVPPSAASGGSGCASAPPDEGLRRAGDKDAPAAPVWSVVCFFVDRRVRRQGVTLGLLKAAVKYARSRGAKIIEGYPVEPGPRLYTYMGSPSTFRQAGFHDVTPPGQARQVMRYIVKR